MNGEEPKLPSGEVADARTSVSPAGLDYEVVRLIGRGAYGEVWLVRDKEGGFQACKVVYRESFDHDRPYEREYEGIRKFEPVSRDDESQLKILHVGRRDEAGYFYYVLELADDANTGRQIDPEHYAPRTLKSELKRQGRLPLNECLQVGLSLSAAVQHLHRNGLIHRDIKPANVIFVNGIPKLADIGLVTDLDVSVSFVGTEGYIPPEGPTSPQADIYGLGKVLYEISTGRDRLDFPQLPTDLAEMPDHQARLEFNAVVTKAAETDPARRYRSAQELHSDLALVQSGGSVRRRRVAARRWRWAGRAAVAMLALTAMVAGIAYFTRVTKPSGPTSELIPKSERIPAPDAVKLRAMEAEIREMGKPRMANARPEAKARWADELIQQSATISDPVRELAMLRVAATVAKQVEDYGLAMKACDKMTERFQLEAVPVKADLLLTDNPPVGTAKGAASLAEAALATGFSALALDDYGRATAMTEIAKSAAATAAEPELAWQDRFLADEVSRCGDAYRQARRYQETLRQNPADPAANLAVGHFLCFFKNDWETGLPMMAHGTDDRLRPILEYEINKKPTRVSEEINVGDLWWGLAAAARNGSTADYQRRARYWYRKGVAQARGTEKQSLKRQLEDRLRSVPPVSAEVHVLCRLSGTDHILLTSDEIRWVSGRGSVNARINQVEFGNQKPGSVRIIRNTGATRLLPDDVDFSTARLAIEQKAKRRGRVGLEVGEDHVRLNLVHSAPGLAEFEVTVLFGPPL